MTIRPLIANTDFAWFTFLAERAMREGGRIDEVNFWRPKSKAPIAKLAAGTPVFFRLKKPH